MTLARLFLLLAAGATLIPEAFGAPCRWTLTPTSPTEFGMLGGTGTAWLTSSDRSCPLPAIKAVSRYGDQYLTITSVPGAGGGELVYRVAPTPSRDLTHYIVVDNEIGLTITVERNTCTYSAVTLSEIVGGTAGPRGGAEMSAAGGTVRLTVTADSDGCPLQPAISDGSQDLDGNWLHWVTVPEMPTGRTATAILTVAPYTGTYRRTASVNLGRVFPPLFYISQAAGNTSEVFHCTCDEPVPRQVRVEGRAELLTDIALNCRGQVPAGGILGDVHVKLNAPVTSAAAGPGLGAPLEALLILDDVPQAEQVYSGPLQAVPASGTPFSIAYGNVYQGRMVAGSSNEVVFTGVPIGIESSRGRTLRIYNLRADATRMPPESTEERSGRAQVSIVAPVAIPIEGSVMSVALATAGAEPAVGRAPWLVSGGIAGARLRLSFLEGRALAFLPRTAPGWLNDKESGYISPAAGLAGSPGQATNGTRLMASFTDVPVGVQLSVPERLTPGNMTLQLVRDPAVNGGGGTLTTGSGTFVTGAVGGRAVVVYEVVSVGDNLDMVEIPVTVYAPAGAEPGGAQVSLSLAPVSDVGTVSNTEPVPRFLGATTRFPAFNVDGVVLNPTSASFSPAANSGAFRVWASGAGIAWTAAAGASWVTIVSGASGVGDGTVSFSVSANPLLTSRTTTITVGGQVFTVTQNGPAGLLYPDTESLRFRYEVGGTLPAPQDVEIVSAGPAVALTPVSSAAWLKVGMTSPVTPARLRIGILPTGLAPGTYYGTVGMEGSFAIQVVLVVAPAPHLRATPAAVAFQDGGGTPVVFFTGGDRPLPFSVRLPSGAPWLQVVVVNDSRLAPANLRLRANAAGLAPGTYQTAVEIVAPEAENSPLSIPVTLTVSGTARELP